MKLKNSFQMIDILGERAYNISTRIGGDYMLDVNMIIANNIQAELKKENKKQVDLAEGIGVSKQTMSKIMNGARAINAIELHKISEYLHVSMDSLMKMPEKPMDMNVIHAFMGRVKTEEARKGIQLADELSDMILFHTRVCENGKKMEQPWEDK
jgi:transcriptional regulator with XRE-family HTH domain